VKAYRIQLSDVQVTTHNGSIKQDINSNVAVSKQDVLSGDSAAATLRDSAATEESSKSTTFNCYSAM